MPVTATLREAFAYFGARAANPRWGWAAQSDDGAVVVLTLWSDIACTKGGTVEYDVRHRGDLENWRRQPGNVDRLRKLVHARDHCGGLFRVVHVTPVDTKAGTRQTRKHYKADEELVMQLVDLNEWTGEFYARGVA